MSDTRMIGQVKWFNNKAGYGFITVNEGEHANKDVFIHYSSIRVTNSQYKYLVQGEYVEFVLTKSSTEGHEFQANDISGIKGGPLMCESRQSTDRRPRPPATPRQPSDRPQRQPSDRPRRQRDPSATPRAAPKADADGFVQQTRRSAKTSTA
jgi:cold shock CspA family protein